RPVKAKKGGGGGITKVCQLSPQLDKFIGTSQIARTEKGLQDPKDGRKILCDEFAAFLVKCISMLLQMNKALSKHIWSLADGGDGESVGSSSPKKMETDGGSDELDENDKKPKKEGCVLLAPDPLPPSDALVKFFVDGESSLSSRSDVVQRLWESIKQNELQVYHLLSTLVYF
ncbi:unnamed protein product, partial [Brassica oleracea var. botrytis]